MKRASKLLLIVFIIASCIYILKPGLLKYIELRNEEKNLKAQIKELEAERAGLEKQMRALEGEDPEQIEKVARDKLHLSKPGETLFRFKKD